MRVLIADDDATSRLVLKAMVTNLGHECLVATDGSRAWDVLQAEEVDVLLTDWMMPGVDGPELCRLVRHDVSDCYVYVVLITSFGNHDQVLEGMSAGADDYLIKPVDPFSVKTRLIAARRVTALHRQLIEVRAQLERANADVTERSLTDPLTGLGNRRRMEEDLARVHARALRTHRTYGVALFDLDHFKAYNDHYGHLAGDDILRRVARCFDSEVRADERLYRYGGEEFLLLLSDSSLEEAAAAAERLRQAVRDLAIEHAARPTEPPVLTMSGGVACATPRSPGTQPELLERADEALFVAKSAGRNRIRLAIPEREPVPASH